MLTLKIVGPLWGLNWKPSVGNSADHCFQKLFKDASCRMRKYGRCNLPRWYRPRCRRFLHRQVWRVNLHGTFWLVVSTCFNHLEKYESMGRIIPYIMENISTCLKPPSPALVLQLGYHGLTATSRQKTCEPLDQLGVPATHVSFSAPIRVSRQACRAFIKKWYPLVMTNIAMV